MKPRALDLYCGAGGASVGLHRAGFDVVGVDIKPQRNYPFAMVVADARHPPMDLAQFDLIWASPPCQANVRGLKNSPGYGQHECHIEEIRELLHGAGRPFIIENVPGAPLRVTVKLSGWEFEGLKVIRERWFETSFLVMRPWRRKPPKLIEQGFLSIAGTGTQKWALDRGQRVTADDARKAMGIDWMTRKELSQAIPPAYAEFLGRQVVNRFTATSEKD